MISKRFQFFSTAKLSTFKSLGISYYSTISNIPQILSSPAASFLIHKHKITQSQIPTIIPTGPKNRILKGDVLKFLQSDTSNQSMFQSIPISYHSALVNIQNTNNINDIITIAAANTFNSIPVPSIKSFPKLVNLRANSYNQKYIRIYSDLPISPKLLPKFNTSDSNFTTFPCVTLLDYSKYPYSIEESYLSPSEVAILLIHPINYATKPTNKNADIIDILSSKNSLVSHLNTANKPCQSTDILEILSTNKISNSFQVELIANSNYLDSKTCSKILEKFKHLVQI